MIFHEVELCHFRFYNTNQGHQVYIFVVIKITSMRTRILMTKNMPILKQVLLFNEKTFL